MYSDNYWNFKKFLRSYLYLLDDLKNSLIKSSGKSFPSLTGAVVISACHDCSMAVVHIFLRQEELTCCSLNEFFAQSTTEFSYELRRLKRVNHSLSARLFKKYCRVLDSAYQLYIDCDPQNIDGEGFNFCDRVLTRHNDFSFVDV